MERFNLLEINSLQKSFTSIAMQEALGTDGFFSELVYLLFAEHK